MNTSHVVTVDWGTTNLRAHLCEIMHDGQLKLLKTLNGHGVSKVVAGFEIELMTLIQPWCDEFPQIPVLLSGLIGSAIGWKEVPYLESPVSPKLLAAACYRFKCQGFAMYIVPGVSCYLDAEYPDVMRGEELQVLGWLQLHESHKQGQHMLCLPGTHTKWVLVQNGEIKSFKTSLTGELYGVLCKNSVLIQNQQGQFNPAVFSSAVKLSLETQQNNIIHSLFSTRSKQLFNEISPEDAPSWLSGLLIASDVQAACNARQWQKGDFQQIVIIGEQHLTNCFSKVLNMNHIQTVVVDETIASIAGFAAIYSGLFNN